MNYKKPNITFESTSPSIQILSNTFTPYNSQNTLFHYSAFWSMYLPKTVSFRLTDIWRSYWSQRLMWLIGGTLSFYGPTASQVRNSHSYMKDYEEEQSMYIKTDELISFLSEWNCSKTKFFDCVTKLSEDMAVREFWGYDEVDAIKNWLNDLTSFGYIEPQMKMLSMSIVENTDYSQIRYTPIYQSSLDADNLCCQNYKPVELYSRLDSYQYLESFCAKNGFNLPNLNLVYFKKYQKLPKLALLVPLKDDISPTAIKFIKHFYGGYFKLIIFCGRNVLSTFNNERSEQKEFDSFSFIELNTSNGLFDYECTSKAIEIDVKVDGILSMSYDVMFKYWNVNGSLSYDKIWFPYRLICNDEPRKENDVHLDWWLTNVGVDAILSTWKSLKNVITSEISSDLETKRVVSEYLHTYKSNYVSENKDLLTCIHMGSKIYYLPKSKFKKFHLLSKIFRENNVYFEAAIPMILSGLASSLDTELIDGKYSFELEFDFDKDYKKIKHFYHPISVLNKTILKDYCKYFVTEKLLYDSSI